jgi:hypothetical protein
MISARALFGHWTVSPRFPRMTPAVGAILAAAALCGCSYSERLPGLTELESSESIQRSMSATAEVDRDDRLKQNTRIDVGDPMAPTDP